MSEAKRILITGGAKRIGAAMARFCAAEGWEVAVHYRSAHSAVESLIAEIEETGGVAQAFQADLAEASEAEALIKNVTQAMGPLTALVHNASRFQYDDLAKVTQESFEAHMRPNLLAPLLLSKAFSSQLPEDRRGVMVMMLDQKLWGLNPDFLSYTLSKVGMKALMEILAMQLAPRVRVCGIAPGVTLPSEKMSESNFAKARAATPLGISSSVDELVEALGFILNSPSMTGQAIVLDGGEHMRRRSRDVIFDITQE